MATDPFLPSMQPAQAPVYDAQLRSYLVSIYNYMTLALALTGAMAYFAARSEAFLSAMYVIEDGNITGMRALAWLIMFSPLGLVMVMGLGMQRMSLGALQVSYWIYSAIMGLSLTVIFLTFTAESIARVFFISAAIFGSMSVYGYTTKSYLGSFGSFLMMGLWGVIVAMLINLFLQSSSLQFALSVIGVLIFTGLTAYDTQKLKLLYSSGAGSHDEVGKLAIMGALTLYLDFINIFLSLLNIFGKRRK